MPLSSKWSSSTSSPHLHCPILEFITWRRLGLYFSGLFVVGILLAEARLCCRRHSRWPDLHSPGSLDLKEHIGVVTGDIAPRKKVPGDVKWQMKRLVLEGKKDRAKKRQLNEEIGNPYGTPTGAANEDDVEVQEVEMFTNPTTPTTTNRKGKEKKKLLGAEPSGFCFVRERVPTADARKRLLERCENKGGKNGSSAGKWQDAITPKRK
ncbi:hypothetical protein MRB53_006021 [Persea americana]|uniref:Uncharacterized protein n=1 Tax=Persea americana TaxID=3435 RepID=A0ACC2MF97_PERAE|nr:hypothetical protein MRB53_006021 [Persea americana]